MTKLTLNSIRNAVALLSPQSGTDLDIAVMTGKVKSLIEKNIMKALMSGDMETVQELTATIKRYSDMSISESKGHIIEFLETSDIETLSVVMDKDTISDVPVSDVVEFLKTAPSSDSDKVKVSDLFVFLLKDKGIDYTFTPTVMPEKAVVKTAECFSMVRDTINHFNTLPADERHGAKEKSCNAENYQLYWNSELLQSLVGYTIVQSEGKLRAVKYKK